MPCCSCQRQIRVKTEPTAMFFLEEYVHCTVYFICYFVIARRFLRSFSSKPGHTLSLGFVTSRCLTYRGVLHCILVFHMDVWLIPPLCARHREVWFCDDPPRSFFRFLKKKKNPGSQNKIQKKGVPCIRGFDSRTNRDVKKSLGTVSLTIDSMIVLNCSIVYIIHTYYIIL